MEATYFEVLGVERGFHLELDQLERNYHERSKLHHPDRHAKSDSQTRVKSALATSQLNQAYRTLKDPLQRAEYLLKLEGIAISDERSGHKVAPAFLMEILELREQLADARAEGDAARVTALSENVRARYKQVQDEIDAGFGRYEAGDRGSLQAVADAMIAERYFRRFLEEADEFQERRAEENS